MGKLSSGSGLYNKDSDWLLVRGAEGVAITF